MLPNILEGFGIEFHLEAAFAVEGWGFEIWISLQALRKISDSAIVKNSISPCFPNLQLGEIFSILVLLHLKIYLPGHLRWFFSNCVILLATSSLVVRHQGRGDVGR
jgi:hypothetical protein